MYIFKLNITKFCGLQIPTGPNSSFWRKFANILTTICLETVPQIETFQRRIATIFKPFFGRPQLYFTVCFLCVLYIRDNVIFLFNVTIIQFFFGTYFPHFDESLIHTLSSSLDLTFRFPCFCCFILQNVCSFRYFY